MSANRLDNAGSSPHLGSNNKERGISLSKISPRVGAIRPAWGGVFILLLATIYFTASGSMYLFTFNLCLLAAFGSIALNVLMGTAGLASVGNAGFLAMGAFTTVFLIRASIPFPLDVVIATLATAVVGIIIGLPALRLRGFHLFLVTLAAHFIILQLALNYQSGAHGSGTSPAGFFFPALYQSRGLEGAQVYWAWTLFALLALLILIITRLVKERCGRAWRMIRDHEPIAHTLGIPVARYKLFAFALSSAIIGLEGSLAAHFSGSVTTDSYTFTLAIGYIAMVVIGGMDSVAGAVVGAVIVTALPIVVPNILAHFISSNDANADGPSLSIVVYGALIIIFVVVSHDGVVGIARGAASRARRAIHGHTKRVRPKGSIVQ